MSDDFTPAHWPTTFVDVRGKRWVIRAMPDALLAVVLMRARRDQRLVIRQANPPTVLLALAREAQARPLRGGALSAAHYLLPPPCACGKPGLYLVGCTTFCRDHASRAALAASAARSGETHTR